MTMYVDSDISSRKQCVYSGRGRGSQCRCLAAQRIGFQFEESNYSLMIESHRSYRAARRVTFALRLSFSFQTNIYFIGSMVGKTLDCCNSFTRVNKALAN
jgi:hypothetical protein